MTDLGWVTIPTVELEVIHDRVKRLEEALAWNVEKRTIQALEMERLRRQVSRLQAALDRAKAECEGYVLKEIEDILNAQEP